MVEANTNSDTQQGKLTRNQSLVFDILQKTEAPLSAYAILDALRGEGLKAPLQIYRALDALIGLGHVHRLESLNAFVACSHGICHQRHASIFMICQSCDNATECTNTDLVEAVDRAAENAQFQPTSAVIELRGTCKNCATE